MNPRQVAYLALLASLRGEGFISHFLEQWQHQDHPSSLDFAFAYEIASGSVRMALSLDYIASQLSDKRKLALKLKERALMRTAIYQYYFMTKVPLYAIVNETVELAKRYCHKAFVSYLNAMLRRLETNTPQLPSGNSVEDLSIRYSYPPFFVSALINNYGKETTEAVLKSGNQPPATLVRVRPNANLTAQEFKHLRPLHAAVPAVAVIDNAACLSEVANSPHCYIQNVTPAILVSDLAERTRPPNRILDMCASPGGKLLAVHDLFPQATLFANDISSGKVLRLSQNLEKYGVSANLSCCAGEEFESTEPFDIIILDVPCSNSGVLNKRPEARWRLTEAVLEDLQVKQLRLLERAAQLVAPGSALWYITCSILKCENEEIVTEACRKYNLETIYSRTILPNTEGWDGGFACLLYKR